MLDLPYHYMHVHCFTPVILFVYRVLNQCISRRIVFVTAI